MPGHDEDIAESKHDRYNILRAGNSCLNYERIEKRLLNKSGSAGNRLGARLSGQITDLEKERVFQNITLIRHLGANCKPQHN